MIAHDARTIHTEDVLKIKKLYFDLRSILNWNQLFVNFNDKLEAGRLYDDGYFSWNNLLNKMQWKKNATPKVR